MQLVLYFYLGKAIGLKVYRRLNQIPSDWGTAVNVQSMVFGNMGNDCATGVAFTRNPSNGIKRNIWRILN